MTCKVKAVLLDRPSKTETPEDEAGQDILGYPSLSGSFNYHTTQFIYRGLFISNPLVANQVTNQRAKEHRS
jgi:hypothetical protein